MRRELGDVDEALDAVEDLHERAERDDLRHRALELVADVVGVDDPLPRVLLGLLEAQGDALAVTVDVQDLDLDRVPDVEDLARVVDVRPRELGDVDEAVDAVEVHERAEVDDVRDDALDDQARLEAVQDLLALLLALLLEHGPSRQDHVVARPVELYDLALDGLAHVLVEVRDAPDVDERRGQEAADAEVDDEAALDHLDDGAGDRRARLVGRLDRPPCLLEARTLLGHDEATVLVLLGEDEGVDLLAELHLLVRIHVLADRELVLRDDSLGLVADVDEDLVLVDADDTSADDLALLEGGEGGVVVRDDVAVDLQQQAVAAFDDLGHGGRGDGLGHVRPHRVAVMPIRATKRGAERTPLSGHFDVIVCGASFGGLAVARELAGSGARTLLVDRYEIGERQSSACAAPTEWLAALELQGTIRQTFADLVIHRPGATYRWQLPWTFSTFDYRELCGTLAAQGDFTFETAKVDGITRGATHTVHTDRGDLRAPLVVDALGWRRGLSSEPDAIPTPPARLPRGREGHPPASGTELELWLDPKYVKAGYSWAFPAGDEVRVGVGAFDPKVHVKQPTVALAEHLQVAAVNYQGNWIPHRLRPATDDGVFMVGDSAGHCLPTTAEGIRPALYFGLACGRELRRVVEGRQTRGQALSRYASFSEDHRSAFDWLWRVQTLVSGVTASRAMDPVLKLMSNRRFVRWAFTHYLNIAPPSFAAA